MRLARLLRRPPAGLELNAHTNDDGAAVFAAACRMGLEGIVSKRLAAPYRSVTSRRTGEGQEPGQPGDGAGRRDPSQCFREFSNRFGTRHLCPQGGNAFSPALLLLRSRPKREKRQSPAHLARPRLIWEGRVAKTILLVDDDPMVLDVLSEMFKILGCTVVTASSAAEALAKVVENPSIDTLVTDVNMPVVSGVELAERVRRIRKDVKTLLISGRESDGHGFPILRKPFDLGALVRTMEKTTGLC